jgi:hypothetical protein
VEQPEQDVFGTNEVVVEQPGLFVGQHQNLTGSVGETFEHTHQ